MGLVAQALECPERRAAAREPERRPALAHDLLLALGEPDQRHRRGADAIEAHARGAHLADPTVDHDQVGPRQLVGLDPRPVALDRLADHREVVRARLADANATVERLPRHAVLARDHRGHGALGAEVRDVEAHHAVRRRRQLERALQVEHLGRVARTTPRRARLEILERVRRVALGNEHEPAVAAALRDPDLDRVPRSTLERLDRHCLIQRLGRHHQAARRIRGAQVVLAQEHVQHSGIVELARLVDQARLLADHLAAAQDQRRHRGTPRVTRHAEHVGVAPAARNHLLGHPRVLEQRDLVAALRRALELAARRRLLHLCVQSPGQLVVAAAQEEQEPVDHRAVLGGIDRGAAIARPDAALDVVVEAGPVGAAVVLEVPAGPHRKDAADLAQRAPQDLDVGVRAEIPRAVVLDLAGDRDPRPLFLDAHPDVREALVVLERHVEAGLVLADERRLEQQRFDLAVGEDEVEVGGLDHQLAQPRVLEVAGQVVADPVAEALGLADVEHGALRVLEQVNPWRRGQIQRLFAQMAHG
jgi:hypothetical protein